MMERDLMTVKIDSGLMKEERIKRFIEDIQNPYAFKVGGMKVRVTFHKGGVSLQEAMMQYFRRTVI